MKKVLAIILSLILILSFVGCKKDTANKEDSSNPENSSVFTEGDSLKDDKVNSAFSANSTSGNKTSSSSKTQSNYSNDDILSNITTENIKINSLDKLNFYAVKKAIAENGVVLLSNSAQKPIATTLANNKNFKLLNLANSTTTDINANSTFTITMYCYFI